MTLIVLIIFAYCSENKKNAPITGKELAEKHCGSCHLPVDPAFLDSMTWVNHVLPAMAPRLGIQVWRQTEYYQEKKEDAPIFLSEWNQILTYYKDKAPKKLHAAKVPEPLRHDWAIFSIKQPFIPGNASPASTTMIVFNPNDKKIYSSNSMRQLIQWDNLLHPIHQQLLPSPAVSAVFSMNEKKRNAGIFTCIGSIQPDDFPVGKIISLDLNNPGKAFDTLASGLLRPVQSIPCDLNKDGLEDWVVCGFGHNQGGLYAFEQKPGSGFVKKTIHALPGAIQATVGDVDGDGWPDIMALFAYADEGIMLFLNDHQGGFTLKVLLRFTAVQGSTSFQLVDFNHDGQLDILYTSGDNADYSRILKPYHGVYIFINEGNFHFRKVYFYPVNGCFKAVARDFDKDGDLDIASIAFFPDMKNNPAEGFIYFEQSESMHFIPHAAPVSGYGRWTCMEVNDMDGDGDEDILLGNYSNGGNPPSGKDTNVYKHTPFIYLQNNTDKLKRK